MSTKRKESEKKWGKEVIKEGWLMTPNLILRYQNYLNLEPIEVNIILQLTSFWWFEEHLPYPTKATIANRIGVSTSTVRRKIKGLEEKGLITRNANFDPVDNSQRGNIHSMEGLVKKLKILAKHHKKIKALKNKKNDHIIEEMKKELEDT